MIVLLVEAGPDEFGLDEVGWMSFNWMRCPVPVLKCALFDSGSEIFFEFFHVQNS